MTKEDYLRILNNVKEITGNDVEDLQQWSKINPYCQNFHVIIAKKYHDLQNSLAPSALHKAAIYSPDRIYLQRIIQDDPSLPIFSKPKQDLSSEQDQTTLETTPDQEDAPIAEERTSSEADVETIPDVTDTDTPRHTVETENPEKEAIDSPEPLNAITEEKEEEREEKEEEKSEKTDIYSDLENTLKEFKAQREQKTNIETDNGRLTQDVTTPPQEGEKTETEASNAETPNASQETTYGENVQDESLIEEKPDKELDQHQIIENFIQLNPSLSRFDLKFDENQEQIEDLSIPKLTIGEDLISENLAIILHKQGKAKKAIDIYEKLILKFPEKKAYFTSCIEKIKNS